MESKKVFVTCSICGKNLIGKPGDGVWEFMFGRSREKNFTPVHMLIQGEIKMRCISRECRKLHPEHWNTLEYFPKLDIFINKQQEETNPAQ